MFILKNPQADGPRIESQIEKKLENPLIIRWETSFKTIIQ